MTATAPAPAIGSPTTGPAPLRWEAPSLRDPRLHIAATLLTIQVLGQTVLDFELSIAQILLALATSAAIEVAVRVRHERVVAWPASALLTGNGVALILRVPGVEPGDWWALDGWWIFVGTAAVSVASKYLVRWDSRPLFNPSNFGLVLCFLVLGEQRANPLDLWWRPLDGPMVAAYAVILVGGLTLVRRLDFGATALAFWLTFSAGSAVVGALGAGFTARWDTSLVTGFEYWSVLTFSPEILIFLLFMITDPKTAPLGAVARVVYATSIGLVATVLTAALHTELSIKVAVLGSLLLVCLVRPLIERWSPGPGTEADAPRPWLRSRRRGLPGLVGLVVVIVVVAGAVAVATRGAAPDPAPAAAVLTGRPAVPPDALSTPDVEVDDLVSDVGGGTSRPLAEAAVRDLLEDLHIEARSVADGDVSLATTALAGPRLDATRERIETTDSAARPIRYDVERATVGLAREEGRFQAPPVLVATLWGTVTIDGTERPFHRTYVLALVGGHHLLADEWEPVHP